MFYVTKVRYEKSKKFCGVAIINERPIKKISHASGIFYDLEIKKYIPLKNSYMIKNETLENILDVILKYGANGITHTQISKKLGYCTPIIRKTSAKIINKIGHKKYIERQRINNTFYYFDIHKAY